MNEELIANPLKRSGGKKGISFQCMHQKVRPIGCCERIEMNRRVLLESPAGLVHSHRAVNRTGVNIGIEDSHRDTSELNRASMAKYGWTH